MIIRKAPAEIERMARAGEVVADTLALHGRARAAGRDHAGARRARREFIRSRGGTPTFKGYRGYPASICASPNDDGRPRDSRHVRARATATSSPWTSA